MALPLCPSCYEITLSDCLDKIILDAGLTPATEYFTRITDKFGNKYNEAITSEADGTLQMDLTMYPTGMFTAHAGVFNLEIFEAAENCEPLTVTLCDAEYNCIQMSFEKINTSAELTEQTIPCGCPEVVV